MGPFQVHTSAAAQAAPLALLKLFQNSQESIMAGLAGETGNAFDARQYDNKMSDLLDPNAEDFAPEWDEVYESFDSMGVHENLLRGIYAYGFEKPSAIQQRGIVPFTKGLDVIQQAQSGTGKTATFCAGILHQLDYAVMECQALVLAPTRELAQQIEKVMRALGDYLQVKCHACVVAPACARIIAPSRAVCTALSAPPVACTTCSVGGRCAPITSSASFSMRLMRCFLVVSRTRFTTSSSCCPPSCRWASSPPPCPRRLWRSPASS